MLDKESLLLHPKYHKRGIGKVTQNLKYMSRKASEINYFSANDTSKKLDKRLLGSKEREEVKLCKTKIIIKILEAEK